MTEFKFPCGLRLNIGITQGDIIIQKLSRTDKIIQIQLCHFPVDAHTGLFTVDR